MPELSIPTLTITRVLLTRLIFDRPSVVAPRSPRHGYARFDFSALLAASLNPKDYGARLSQALFEDTNLLSFFEQNLNIARATGQPYRLHLRIDANAPELHSLHWETLLQPNTEAFIAQNANLLWSRELYSEGWEIPLRPKRTMRARSSLKGFEIHKLASPVDHWRL